MATVAETAGVLLHQDGPAARITLNRAEKRNALSIGLMEELIATLRSASDSPDVRAVVIDAAGPRSPRVTTCPRSSGGSAVLTRLFDVCCELMNTIHAIPQPVIAQVEGIATAAGCQLVAACDLAVAAEDARSARRV